MKKRVIRVVAAVIERSGRYLITQRQAAAILPLLWEFPGGRVEEGEADEEALKRELVERIGVTCVIGPRIGEHHHKYDGYDVHMSMFSCGLPAGAEPEVKAVNDFRWVTSAEMAQYEFPPADQQTTDKLLGLERYEL